ncbi:Methyltransferase domain-containing protein [Poseidonocella pacifica]|uniref:Methyltransferase domain-containing protein n=1 Tax=Poseidonocella pacifica TaxID=871651 RepID=A0A1I0VTJ7_9RHOB|nr:methyltransferase domain-containing protein [Poseidonocella pacifica]SFA79654.1 Methyltransferase domain-containing protein [Poseidonocella pacifica]
MSGSFLDKIFTARRGREMRELYDAWSHSYDEEVAGAGYATPARCAAALSQHFDLSSGPILDYGCGTGLSGQALHDAGATVIDGVDVSADMLAKADAKGVYRKLIRIQAKNPPDFGVDYYPAITAIGSIGKGAAPISVFDRIMGWLQPGAVFCFSFNDLAIKVGRYESRLNEHLDTGSASLLFREHGPHLPAKELGAVVYVIRKS